MGRAIRRRTRDDVSYDRNFMIFISEFVTHSWWIYNFNIIGELDVMAIILQDAHIKQLFFF